MSDTQDLIFRLAILIPGVALYSFAFLCDKNRRKNGWHLTIAFCAYAIFTMFLFVCVNGSMLQMPLFLPVVFFMFLPNTLLYCLVITPALLFWSVTRQRVIGCVLLVASLCLFSFGLPFLSNVRADRSLAAAIPPKPDDNAVLPQSPRYLNFIKVMDTPDANWYPDCDTRCERLLKSGLVDRVRITYTSPDRIQSKSKTFRQGRAGNSEKCPNNICVVEEKDDNPSAYIALSEERQYLDAANDVDRRAEQYRVYDMSRSPPLLLYSAAKAEARALKYPFMISEEGYIFRRTKRYTTWAGKSSEVHFDSILIEKLGFPENIIYGR